MIEWLLVALLQVIAATVCWLISPFLGMFYILSVCAATWLGRTLIIEGIIEPQRRLDEAE